MTSTELSASSAAMLVAFVMTVRFLIFRTERAIAVVVVPESRMITWPWRIMWTAASAMRSFSRRCICSFSWIERSRSAPVFTGKRAAVRALKLSFVLQEFEVFANGDLRRAKTAGERADKHASFGLQHFENFAAAFFAKHGWEYASSLCSSSSSSQGLNLNLIAEALDVVQTNATGKIGQDIRGAASNREPQSIRRLETAARGKREASNRSIAAAYCRSRFEFWGHGDECLCASGTQPDQAVGAETDRGALRAFADEIFQCGRGRGHAIDRAADEPFGFFLIGLGEIGALLQTEF